MCSITLVAEKFKVICIVTVIEDLSHSPDVLVVQSV